GIRGPLVTGVQTCALPIWVFLAFQYPVAIRGITNAYFLRSAVNAIRKYRGEEEFGPVEFMDALAEKLQAIGWDDSYLSRPVNERSEERRVGKECERAGQRN